MDRISSLSALLLGATLAAAQPAAANSLNNRAWWTHALQGMQGPPSTAVSALPAAVNPGITPAMLPSAAALGPTPFVKPPVNQALGSQPSGGGQAPPAGQAVDVGYDLCLGPIYKAERERREVKAIKDFNNAVTRFENLAERRDTQLDYQLLTHDSHSTAVDKMFTHKASSALGIRGEPTINDPSSSYNLRPRENGIRELPFRSNQEQRLREMNPARTERLHNIGTRGKPYDIISGVALPVRPTATDSTMFEHDRRAHPSNLAVPHEGVFGGYSTAARTRGFTAPTLSGPIPDAHQSMWQPPSPTRAGSKVYMS